MYRLEKLGDLPLIFLYLKDDVPFCESCVFGTSMRGKWITKGDKLGSIKKYNDNNPEAGVSVDQL